VKHYSVSYGFLFSVPRISKESGQLAFFSGKRNREEESVIAPESSNRPMVFNKTRKSRMSQN